MIGHLHLHVSELQKTEEFYRKGLSFDVVNRFGDQALFISTGNYHHQMALNTWAGVRAPTPPLNSVGLKSFTLILADEAKREQIIAQLKELHAVVTEENDSFITYNPSGHRIYLV